MPKTIKKKSPVPAKPEKTTTQAEHGQAWVGAGRHKWDPDYYIPRAVECARRGMSRDQAAAHLGVSSGTMKFWWNTHPELRDAVTKAREELANPEGGTLRGGAPSGQTYRQFVIGRLSPELRRVWDRIANLDRDPDHQTTLEDILQGTGKWERIQLWLYAWEASAFNKSEACRKLGIHRKTLVQWEREVEGFSDLLEEMLEIRKDYAEECLFRLAPENAQVAIFLNRCLNKDRGYDPKVGVDHTGTVSHELVDLTVLDGLPLEDRRELLRLMRLAKSRALPPRTGTVIDQTPPKE